MPQEREGWQPHEGGGSSSNTREGQHVRVWGKQPHAGGTAATSRGSWQPLVAWAEATAGRQLAATCEVGSCRYGVFTDLGDGSLPDVHLHAIAASALQHLLRLTDMLPWARGQACRAATFAESGSFNRRHYCATSTMHYAHIGTQEYPAQTPAAAVWPGDGSGGPLLTGATTTDHTSTPLSPLPCKLVNNRGKQRASPDVFGQRGADN